MVCFGTLYEYFVTIIYSMYTGIMDSAFGGGLTSDVINWSGAFSVIGGVIIFVVALEIFMIYIQVLSRGIQILVLRIGIVFAAIGLINADGGVFKGYIKKFLTNAFTLFVQIFLCELSVALLAGKNYMLALIAAATALKGGDILKEFLQSTGSATERGLLANAQTISSTAHYTSSMMRGASNAVGTGAGAIVGGAGVVGGAAGKALSGITGGKKGGTAMSKNSEGQLERGTGSGIRGGASAMRGVGRSLIGMSNNNGNYKSPFSSKKMSAADKTTNNGTESENKKT